MSLPGPDDVIAYWLGPPEGPETEILEEKGPLWFQRSDATDAEIRRRFGALHDEAAGGGLADWEDEARSRLALIIVLDQFSRNLYRDDARAFAQDERARALTCDGIEGGMDRSLRILERYFFYMPLMHAEDLELQERCVDLFHRLAAPLEGPLRKTIESARGYAERHRAVIARFGRFPHRNEVLGRASTPEEKSHLAAGKPF